MILAHPTFDRMRSINEGKIEVLVVENKNMFSKYIAEINSQIQGNEGYFKLYKNNEELPLSFVDLIINPFDINPNCKSVLSTVYSKLKTILLDENHYQSTNVILQSVENYMSECAEYLDSYLMISEGSNSSSLVKLVDPKFILSKDSLLECICDYLRIVKQYTQIELFIFVNLKTFLNREDLRLLYDFLFMNKIPVLLLENCIHELIECETLCIIDSDLCEIGNY
ncbi:MAG: type II-A CRISPR-associated protein Csn2 [Lachnospiraceae bacterium]|nr:type II-A CRISPR-associated protein Csn2 [Lachnospiraceae bacterium]